MHGGAQQALRIPVQRHRRSHHDSMMLVIIAVKMRNSAFREAAYLQPLGERF
jgi:hypothetical protein